MIFLDDLQWIDSASLQLLQLLEKLIAIVIENAGAKQCHLILNSDHGFFIEASRSSATEMIEVNIKETPEDSDRIPGTIINYVIRTGDTLAINDASQKRIFARDPYIRTNSLKSVLCFPITHQSGLTVILYLENNAVREAFTKKRLEMLRHLPIKRSHSKG